MDLDNDLDLVAAGFWADEVRWWENDGEMNFTSHLIADHVDGINCVLCGDLDNDGDVDVAGTAENDNLILWWENDGEQNYERHEIEHDLSGLKRIWAEDFDFDDVPELFVSADHHLAVFRNDGSGAFTQETFAGNFEGAFAIYPWDMDGDTDIDVVSCASVDGEFGWWESNYAQTHAHPTRHFNFDMFTGNNHSLLMTEAFYNDQDHPLAVGNEIGVFTPNGTCAGGVTWMGEMVGLTAWGDDDSTDQIEGFQPGEDFSFKVWDGSQGAELPAFFEVIEGDDSYEVNGFTAFSLTATDEIQVLFHENWNMISVNVQLLTLDIVELMRPLVNQDDLILLKDGAGRYYSPQWGYNGIPRWEIGEGYQAKVTRNFLHSFIGPRVPFNQPIQVISGWQIVAYFPEVQVEAMEAFRNIENNLEIAKDVDGHFYTTIWGYSNMGNLSPSQGYQVKMREEDELVWNVPGQLANKPQCDLEPTQFKCIPNTGHNMSVLLLFEPLNPSYSRPNYLEPISP